ncbi:MAG: cytochrome b [Steroidobacteraceae bacterium]
MQWRNSADAYGALAKLLHWTIVVLIIAQYVIIEAADEMPKGPAKFAQIDLHKSVGMTILILAVTRILWRIANRGAPAPVAMPRSQQIAAAAGHGLLYLLVLVLPISGWAMSSAANYPVTLFGWFQFPAIVGTSHDLHETLEEVHEFLFYTTVVVATLHAVAALYHHVVMKDSSLRRMLPFGGSSRP